METNPVTATRTHPSIKHREAKREWERTLEPKFTLPPNPCARASTLRYKLVLTFHIIDCINLKQNKIK